MNCVNIFIDVEEEKNKKNIGIVCLILTERLLFVEINENKKI